MKFTEEVTPPRPKLDRAGIAEAVKELAEQLDIAPDDIAEHFRIHDDGYELAKNLERHGYYDLDLNAANELDSVSSIVREKEMELQKLWVKAYDVQPPLPNGAQILQGVIDSVCDHEPATYRVKQTGCTQDGRYLLIKFENAFLVDAAKPQPDQPAQEGDK